MKNTIKDIIKSIVIAIIVSVVSEQSLNMLHFILKYMPSIDSLANINAVLNSDSIMMLVFPVITFTVFYVKLKTRYDTMSSENYKKSCELLNQVQKLIDLSKANVEDLEERGVRLSNNSKVCENIIKNIIDKQFK